MKKERISPSEFRDLPDIEYFLFEEDFIEEGVRCIPMIVRFKMDHTGIKLKLAEWNKFSVEEKIRLARNPCSNEEEEKMYKGYLAGLIKKYTGMQATALAVDKNPEWANTDAVPEMLSKKLAGFGWHISIEQWKGLSDLQRFALMKLCREGHENKNFPKAMKELKLV